MKQEERETMCTKHRFTFFRGIGNGGDGNDHDGGDGNDDDDIGDGGGAPNIPSIANLTFGPDPLPEDGAPEPPVRHEPQPDATPSDRLSWGPPGGSKPPGDPGGAPFQKNSRKNPEKFQKNPKKVQKTKKT